MKTMHRTVVFHTFRGGRFDDHGIDLSVLEDLLRYRTILVELAKVLWRGRNPSRERLPPNFEESLALRFYEVQPNCATIPLERSLSVEQNETFWPEDELEDAVELVTRTVAAAGNDQLLPEEFPKEILTLFEDYGKTLRDDEWFEHRPPKAATAVRFDATIRARLVEAMNVAYEAFVDVTGVITMARVSRPQMAVQLDDGREIMAPFDPVDEQTIIAALKDHATMKIRVVGRGRFAPDGRLQKITLIDRITPLPGGERPFDPSAKPIWEEFDEITANLPPELLARLPVDGSERHDYYAHGSPGHSP